MNLEANLCDLIVNAHGFNEIELVEVLMKNQVRLPECRGSSKRTPGVSR